MSKVMMSLSVKLKSLLIAAIISLATAYSAFAQVPARPNPPRLVNDFASIFTPEQVGSLESILTDFANSTSNQIVVVTLNDLGGDVPAQLAFKIGDSWGVGQKSFDNGVVILIKPKSETKGEAFIATGYGLEGAIPDAICKRIVTKEMIPSFRENDYYSGVKKGLDVIMKLASGEYSTAEYAKKTEDDGAAASIGVVIFVIVIALLFIIGGRKGPKNLGGGGGRRSGLGPWEALFLASMLSGGGRRSSGGFGSGGGFGGGGFGGFGGGGFGGGGAGGSW